MGGTALFGQDVPQLWNRLRKFFTAVRLHMLCSPAFFDILYFCVFSIWHQTYTNTQQSKEALLKEIWCFRYSMHPEGERHFFCDIYFVYPVNSDRRLYFHHVMVLVFIFATSTATCDYFSIQLVWRFIGQLSWWWIGYKISTDFLFNHVTLFI